ncbi:MAG: hypothetical protein U0103_23390 [Candidatus Obscuribacterales bacterium]|nr:hypothetical protein [Cyanobacteria bacterium SZAS LIN-5]
MSSFENASAGTQGMVAAASSAHLRTRLEVESPDNARQAASKANWSNLLFAAKIAYSKGYKNDALRLYQAGLAAASRAMDERDELIEFLTENVWSS